MKEKDLVNQVTEIIKEKNIPLSNTEMIEIMHQHSDKYLKDIDFDYACTKLEDILNKEIENKSNNLVKLYNSPDRFYMKDSPTEGLPDRTNIPDNKLTHRQKDILSNIDTNLIHDFLSYYFNNYLDVNTKTITYKDSDTSNYIKWLHPSMVGVYYKNTLSNLDKKEKTINDIINFVYIYSFEIVKKIGFYNLKEAYFQALSTSYWANKSYLVCVEIEDENDITFKEDLYNLGNKYGMGLLKINIFNPDSSNIIMPACSKRDIDWEITDKLTEENINFKSLFRDIIKNYKKEELDKEHFNNVKSKEHLQKLITSS